MGNLSMGARARAGLFAPPVEHGKRRVDIATWTKGGGTSF